MARDYRKRRPNTYSSNLPKRLGWLSASFLTGYFVASLVDFQQVSAWVNQQIVYYTATSGQKRAVQQAALPKPKLEFYTLLAKEQAPRVFENPPAQTAATIPPVPALTNPTVKPAPVMVQSAQALTTTAAANNVPFKNNYLLQIASFKNRQDAEKMKASLALKGFDVSVVVVTQSHANWYRVIVGPFATKGQAAQAQAAVARSERVTGMIRRMDA